MTKLNAKQLRRSEPIPSAVKKIKRNPIYFVLDEIIDTFNVGSLYRLADAVAAEKMYLCGNMEYPPNTRIHRAAVGTENWTPWEKVKSAHKLVLKLKAKGIFIVAVEQNPKSIAYTELRGASSAYSLLPKTLRFPVALILGHETKGIDEEVLKLADVIVELPMYGINKSFNVWGSASIVAYKILESL